MRTIFLLFTLYSSFCLASFQEKGIQFAIEELLKSRNYEIGSCNDKKDSGCDSILVEYDSDTVYYNGFKRVVMDDGGESGWFEATLELMINQIPQSITTRVISIHIKKIDSKEKNSEKNWDLNFLNVAPSIYASFGYSFNILNSDGEQGDNSFTIGVIEFEKIVNISNSSEIKYIIEAIYKESFDNFYIKELYFSQKHSIFDFKIGIIPNNLTLKSDSTWRYRFFIKDGEESIGLSNISDIGFSLDLLYGYFKSSFGVLSGVGYKKLDTISENSETLFFDAQIGKKLFLGFYGDYDIDSSENSYKAVFYSGFISSFFNIYYRFVFKSDKSTGDKIAHILSTSLIYSNFSIFFRGFIWDQNGLKSNDTLYDSNFGVSYLGDNILFSIYGNVNWIENFNQSVSILTAFEFWF